MTVFDQHCPKRPFIDLKSLFALNATFPTPKSDIVIKPPCTYQGLGNLVVDKVKKPSTIKSEYGQFLTPCDSIKRQECSTQMRSRSESGTRSSVTKTTVLESPNLGNSVPKIEVIANSIEVTPGSVKHVTIA